MNPKIREDTRTLQDFYPDPRARHQVHYQFAHGFLPQYVWQNPYAFFSYLFDTNLPGGALEPVRFIQSRWMLFEETAGLIPLEPVLSNRVFRRVSDIGLQIGHLEGSPTAMITMPPPGELAEAFAVTVILMTHSLSPESWARNVEARIFTLEMTASRSEQESLAGCSPKRGTGRC